ncbi:hypothetical protein F4809DRAFT_199476 [Biscogniauxia mediterranea]|nr:hypothetical protein F4809DRAFT_199476 [Biscogniauxia mediterranea]
MPPKRATKAAVSSSGAAPSGSRSGKGRAPARTNSGQQSRSRGSTKKRGPNDDANDQAAKKRKASDEDDPEENFEDNPEDDPEDDVEVEVEDPSNGLDRSLPPISSVNAAFIDLVKKADHDLKQIAHVGAFNLRVATMCSGTEAPIFALKMAQEAYGRLHPGEQFLNFNHVFSVENEDYKQAYIARNTEGSIVFRDVRDFVDLGATHAPTAMGGLAPIPKDIDILIAGCSCVEFSNLNTKKKTDYNDRIAKKGNELLRRADKMSTQFTEDVNALLDDIIKGLIGLGDSGQTFFSMLSYVRNHKPKVVILENVMNAPWEQNRDLWFHGINYASTFVKLDTKDFWIPQTRTRGYLIAVHRGFFKETSGKVTEAWANAVKNLKRRASAPVTDWLLPPTHSLAIRACQDDAEKSFKGKERDVSWTRSKVRHDRVRRIEGLGDARPMTNWGSVVGRKPWDKMSQIYISSLNNRSKDCIEIWQLRALKTGVSVNSKRFTYDTRHKIRIFDLSQNIDRGVTGSPFGVSPCNTPRGDFYLSNQGRSLSGYESLGLQGLPIFHLRYSYETQDQLRDLAGNAMSTTVVGATLLGVLTAIYETCGKEVIRALQPKSAGNSSVVQRSLPEFRQDLKACPSFTTMATYGFSVSSLIKLWERCRRYCYCNGAAKYSLDQFYRCSVCGTIRCYWCAGNPTHEFEVYTRAEDLVLLEAVPHTVMNMFPSKIMYTPADNFAEGYKFAKSNKFAKKTVSSIPQLASSLRSATFYYKEVHVTEVITICFAAKDAKSAFNLNAVVSADGLVWYLYLDPWCELGQKTLRSLKLSTTNLAHPIARAIIPRDAGSPVPPMSSWELWSFHPASLSLGITSSQNEACLNITIVNHQETSGLPQSIERDLRSIPGRFVHKPHCDSAENSLHVCHENRLYLFKDPGKTSSPDQDCYVISKDCRLLEHYETRESLVKLPRHFNPKGLVSEEVVATIEGIWLEPLSTSGDVSFHRLTNPLESVEGLDICTEKHATIGNEDHAARVIAQFQLVRHTQGDSFMVLPKYEHTTQETKDWITVERHDQPALFDLVAPVNVKLADTDFLDYGADLSCPETCSWCSPPMPTLHWIKNMKIDPGDKRELEPHRAYEEMTKYDDQLHRRFLPFEIQVKVTALENDMLSHMNLLTNPDSAKELKVISMRYAVNPVVLMHQALSLLPSTRRALTCSEVQDRVTAFMRTESRAAANLNYKFEPFTKSLIPLSKRKNKVVPATQPRALKTELSTLQKESLGWMIKREQGDDTFTEREVEEHLVPELKLRLLGCAQRQVCRRGGVLADEVGYGKTVVSLALMSLQQKFDETESMRLRAECNNVCIHLKASLVVVPKHLVDQWAKEAKTFLDIRNDEVLTIKTMSSLKSTALRKFETARIIIVSNSIFNERKYHFTLAKYAGAPKPPAPESDAGKAQQRRAFKEWYETNVPVAQSHLAQRRVALDRGDAQGREDLDTLLQSIRERFTNLQDTHDEATKDRFDDTTREGRLIAEQKPEAIKKDKGKEEATEAIDTAETAEIAEDDTPDDPFSEFVHLLESFSYARVIYDEFSYVNSATSLFFQNVTAVSKWVLSATPPTRNLAAICDTAGLLNVHIARPMDMRMGLPRITDGPATAGKTKAETYLSYSKLPSEKCVWERQEKAYQFLEFFASANPIDTDHFGAVKIKESVIVCNMRIDEMMRYLNLQSEIQDHNLDVELLPREFRKLLPRGLNWSEGSGKVIATQALMFIASLPPDRNVARPDDLKSQQIELLDLAKAHLKLLWQKVAWLADRIKRNEAEMKKQSAADAVEDVCMLFDTLLRKDYGFFSGHDGWKAVYDVIFGDKPLEDVLAEIGMNGDEPVEDGTLLHGLETYREEPWITFFPMSTNEADRVGDAEAEYLLNDIVQKYKDKTVLCLAKDSPKDKLKETLAKIETACLQNQRESIDKEKALAEKIEDIKKLSGVKLKETCREACIKFSSSEKKLPLATRLAKHELGILPEDSYTEIAFRKLKSAKFPFLGGDVSTRGGVYTNTRNEIVDGAIAFKAAIDCVVQLAKQVRIVENILRPKYEQYCDNCGAKSNDLHLVAQCGHLLCPKHLGDGRCGDAVRESLGCPSQCPSVLQDRVMPMSKVGEPQRMLPSKSQDESNQMQLDASKSDDETDPLPSLSSKTQMIVDVIRSVPEDECVLLFAQYDKQLQVLREALTHEGIYVCVSRDEKAPKVRLLKLNDAESAGSNFQYANHVMFACPLLVNLQEYYNSFMKQATGRCVRFGQKKLVHVYHFVMAHSIEVDVLELRRQSHVLVKPGHAYGELVYHPPENRAKLPKDKTEDTVMRDTVADPSDPRERVFSNVSPDDVWAMMNERNWLTTVGIET